MNFKSILVMFQKFFPAIWAGYYDLLWHLFDNPREVVLRIELDERISNFELDCMSTLITLAPGTIAINNKSHLLVHCLSFAIQDLIRQLNNYMTSMKYKKCKIVFIRLTKANIDMQKHLLINFC
jgi:multisubunit Na+/H+ antiporter MnhE subunit